jgi:hypothetical protein
MEQALDHFSQASIFGRSALLLLIILAANFAITAVHSWQEWKGPGGPLWRNFGAIVGLKIPDLLGFLGFTVLLTLTLWILGSIGIAGWLPFLGPVGNRCTAFALGALIGARLSDTLVSHLWLYIRGYRPNPGLISTPLYVLEAIFMIVVFGAGLQAALLWAAFGILAGAGFFAAVLPSLRWLRTKIPAWQQAPWQPGQPMP